MPAHILAFAKHMVDKNIMHNKVSQHKAAQRLACFQLLAKHHLHHGNILQLLGKLTPLTPCSPEF